MDERQIFETAQQAAQEASRILMEFLGSAKVQQKSSHNLVTQADLEAEAAVKKLIHSTFPDHKILGEEGGYSGAQSSDMLWIVDPLDGTNNYAHGIPQFSVSIAFAIQGEVRIGVITDPTRNESFTAIKGQGAFLNDAPIHVSMSESLEDSIIATGFYYDRGEMMERTLRAIRRLFAANVRGIRRFGSAALDLAWVACGRMEGFFEYELSPWDFAAGALIIREAGGTCYDRNGVPISLESKSVAVTNGSIDQEMLDCVLWNKNDQ